MAPTLSNNRLAANVLRGEASLPTDPRHRNRLFDVSSITSYAQGYADRLKDALHAVDMAAVARATEALSQTAALGHRIYVAGNGGSAAIADHLCCDWTKGTHCADHPVIRTHSLSANVALYSAVANDYGFDTVFSTQVDFFGEAGDLLIAISSSGNSANIVGAVERARARGMRTIGFSGFSGGRLREACDIPIHVAADNYGIVEDAHQAIMHVIAQFTAIGRDRSARPVAVA